MSGHSAPCIPAQIEHALLQRNLNLLERSMNPEEFHLLLKTLVFANGPQHQEFQRFLSKVTESNASRIGQSLDKLIRQSDPAALTAEELDFFRRAFAGDEK